MPAEMKTCCIPGMIYFVLYIERHFSGLSYLWSYFNLSSSHSRQKTKHSIRTRDDSNFSSTPQINALLLFRPHNQNFVISKYFRPRCYDYISSCQLTMRSAFIPIIRSTYSMIFKKSSCRIQWLKTSMILSMIRITWTFAKLYKYCCPHDKH